MPRAEQRAPLVGDPDFLALQVAYPDAEVGRGGRQRKALFAFLRSMVLDFGATDQGLVEALGGLGIDVESAAPDAEDAFRGLLGELLVAAQGARTVRSDVDVPEIKALMVGCQAMQGYDKGRAARVTDVVHARRDQVEKAYPAAPAFVAAKRSYDPNLLFRNAMWDAYFA